MNRDKRRRLVAIFCGGGCLGASLWGVPGAIIGSLIGIAVAVRLNKQLGGNI